MERRLAAILCLDMVAYSRLVEADESGTLTRLRTLVSELIEPTVERHDGRVVKGTGDGVLAEFTDAADAIDCAIEIQQATAEHEAAAPKARCIAFRIGINVGDIYAEDGDIYGNGVNVAARLESLADPGGILVSGSAREQLRNPDAYGLENLGPHLVKNIKTPVQVYRVLPAASRQGFGGLISRLRRRQIVTWTVAYFAGAWLLLEMFDLIAEQFLMPVWVRQGASVALLFGGLITVVLAWYHGERGRQKVGAVEFVLLAILLALGAQSVWLLRDRSHAVETEAGMPTQAFRAEPLPQNSVAVLPCLNLGGDENRSYFADGLAAELITRLSAVSGLRIPSHTSSFSFKGKDVTIREIATALKVRHVLECDVSGDISRLRASARLIDTETGYTLWSQSYDRSEAQLFDVQQDVAQAVVENLELQLGVRERQLVRRRWTESTEAYDEFLRGIKYQLIAPTEENINKMRQHFERAVELDPGFGRGYARLAVTWVLYGNYQLVPASEAYAEVERLANIAIELDGELYEAYWALGWADLAGKYAWLAAEENFRKTIDLAPGEWAGYHSLGYVLGAVGQIQAGLEAARTAIELDPLAFFPRHGLKVLLNRQRNYAASIPVLEEQAEIHGWNPQLQAGLAWLLARTGRAAEARVLLADIEAMEPPSPLVHLTLAVVYAILGERDKALEIAERWESRAQIASGYNMAGALAAVYAELENRDRAMHWLTQSRKEQSMWMLFLDNEEFDCLRRDARFVDLIRELQLPEDVYLRISEPASGTAESS